MFFVILCQLAFDVVSFSSLQLHLTSFISGSFEIEFLVQKKKKVLSFWFFLDPETVVPHNRRQGCRRRQLELHTILCSIHMEDKWRPLAQARYGITYFPRLLLTGDDRSVVGTFILEYVYLG